MIHVRQCFICQHLIDGTACKAFPNGIPTEVLDGDFDHLEPIEGDNGIQFLADPGMQHPTLWKASNLKEVTD